MKVSELIQLESPLKYRQPVCVEGYLILSGLLTYVVDSRDEAYSGRPHFGMVLSRKDLIQLEKLDLPMLAGSAVLLVGQIKLKGTVSYTGLSLLPICMSYIYEYSFIHPSTNTEYHFKISDVFRNVYLINPGQISAGSLRAIQPFLAPSLTIMQAKHLVLNQSETLVGEHVEGDDYANRIHILEENQLPYRVEECEICHWGTP